jgi:membrane-bound ClpP family serine protease
MRINQMAWLDATAAFATLVVGLLGVYWELARPAWVAPGAVGLVVAVVAAVRLGTMQVTGTGMALLGFGLVLVGLSIIGKSWIPGGLLGGVAIGFAMTFWGAGEGERVRWWVALPLGVGWGWVTVVLGSAAWRGFWLKRNW